LSARGRAGAEPINLANAIAEGLIEYIPMPDALNGKYQSFTEADMRSLREQGYSAPFHTVEEGVSRYMDFLEPIQKN